MSSLLHAGRTACHMRGTVSSEWQCLFCCCSQVGSHAKVLVCCVPALYDGGMGAVHTTVHLSFQCDASFVDLACCAHNLNDGGIPAPLPVCMTDVLMCCSFSWAVQLSTLPLRIICCLRVGQVLTMQSPWLAGSALRAWRPLQ